MKKKEWPKVTLENRLLLVDVHEARRAGIPEQDLRTPHETFLRTARQIDLRSTWVEDCLGGWMVAYRIVSQDGAPVVGEIRIFPFEETRKRPGLWSGELLGAKAKAPHGGITAELLRRIRVTEPLTVAGKILERFRQLAPWHLDARELTAPLRRRGPKGHPDRFYAEVAQEYVAAFKAGSRSPAGDVARRRRLTPARIRDLLHEARRRRLLTPATMHGRGGGDVTPRGRAAIAASKRQLNG